MPPVDRTCTRCVMDTSDPDIQFDDAGVCHHCRRFDELDRTMPFRHGGDERLRILVEEIRAQGRGKKYDCVIGVSGGVDSTYVAYRLRELDLRPLAVHFDNGWDSELAVSNIEKTLKRLGIDLITHVVEWEEFKDIQRSFLRASVPDGEIPTDHAISALLFRMAETHGLRYIVSGGNHTTEQIMPVRWSYGVKDGWYIRDVHRQFGRLPLRDYPHYGVAKLLYYMYVRGIQTVRLLDYRPYIKQEAMRTIEKELGWEYYGGKHYESIYTRFFQAYILPRKFNIDKRRAHLSTLIASQQITRDEALAEMRKDVCPPNVLEADRVYVIKKLGLTEAEFTEIMNLPCRSFLDYRTFYPVSTRLRRGFRRLREARSTSRVSSHAD